jgi:uncharacterized protein (UPF0261 family)
LGKRILLIGTFDTKAEEFAYVCKLIEKRGHKTVLLDVSVLHDPSLKPDITAEEIAKAGESSLKKLREKSDRSKAVEVMIAGVRVVVPRLYAEDRFDGVLSLGGGTGTNIATAAMRELPIGVPKFMVSSVASGDVGKYVDIKDISMMNSVVDIAGLNRLSRGILTNAVGAICGMVEQEEQEKEDKPIIVASMFGVTTPCVTRVRNRLEEAGYEVVVFHATGKGGRAMEKIIEEDFVVGIADITTTEWGDEVVGGDLSAGSDRLSAAAKKGIPQVISCGALDMVNFRGGIEAVPKKFRGRNLYRHHPNVTLMRTTSEECQKIGEQIAAKLNKAKGPVVLLLPLKGLSMIDKEGEPFYNPEANQALFESLKQHIRPPVEILELNMHINEPKFADIIADRLLSFLK